MALPWKDVVSNPEFQALPYNEQLQVRNEYFDNVVMPNVQVSERIAAFDEFSGYADELFKSMKPQPAPEPQKESGFLSNIGTLAKSGYETASESVRAQIGGDEDIARITAERNRRMAGEYQPPELLEVKSSFKDEAALMEKGGAWNTTKGIAGIVGEIGKQVLTNPKGVAYLGAEQAANMAAIIAGRYPGVAGGTAIGTVVPLPGATVAGGLIGGALTGGTAEYALEAGGATMEGLARRAQAAGIDIKNEDAIRGFIQSNPQALAESKEEGAKKGFWTALVDQAMMGVSGRIASAPARAAQKEAAAQIVGTNAKLLADKAIAKTVANKADEILKAASLGGRAKYLGYATGTEMLGGMGSEAAGQYAAYDKLDWNEVALEGLGELVTGPVEAVAVGRDYTRDMRSLRGQQAQPAPATDPSDTINTVLNAGNTGDPAQDIDASIATMNDIVGADISTLEDIEPSLPTLPPKEAANVIPGTLTTPESYSGTLGIAGDVVSQQPGFIGSNAITGRGDIGLGGGVAPTGALPQDGSIIPTGGQLTSPRGEAVGLQPAQQQPATPIPTASAAGEALSALPGSIPLEPVVPKSFINREAVVFQNRDRSTPALISQMRGIAKAPDYTRVAPGYEATSGAPIVEGELPASAVIGKKSIANTANKKLEVQYAVVEADDLIASHSVDGSPVAGYEQGEPGKLRAIGGNARVAGIKEAYRAGSASEYATMLRDDTAHGVPSEAIAGMRNPVLVRIMRSEDVTPNIGIELNARTNAAPQVVDQAKDDARSFKIENIELSEDGSPSSSSLRQFVLALPENERAGLMDRGQPNKNAQDRLNAAIFYQAYGNDELVRIYAESTDEEAKAVINALAMAAPSMAKLEGADVDVREIVTDAAKIAIAARRAGKSLLTASQQMDIEYSDPARWLVGYFAQNIRAYRKIGEMLTNLANRAYDESTKPSMDMFGPAEKKTAEQLLQEQGYEPRSTQRVEHQRRLEPIPGARRGETDGQDGRIEAQADQVAAQNPQERLADADIDAALGEIGDVFGVGQPETGYEGDLLSSYSAEELKDRKAQLDTIEKEKEKLEARLIKEEKDRLEHEDIKRRSVAAASTFTLGGDAATNLSGQSSLFQKAKHYDPNQLLIQLNDQPLRPGEDTEQTRNDRAGLATSVLVRGHRGSLLGLAIATDWIVGKGSSLLGKRVTSPQDLATLGAVLRDPRAETFRYFLMKDGKVVYHTAVSSRLLGSTRIFIGEPEVFLADIKATMEKLGADGYYLMHNHPARVVVASKEDVQSTEYIANNLPGFLGHVILDHTEFGLIEAKQGRYDLEAKDIGAQPLNITSQDPTRTNPIPHAKLDEVIASPNALASMADAVRQPSNIVLVAVDHQMHVTGIMQVSRESMKKGGLSSLKIMARLRKTAGAHEIFAILPDGMKFDELPKHITKNGWLLDVHIAVAGRGVSAVNENMMAYQRGGAKRKDKLGMVVDQPYANYQSDLFSKMEEAKNEEIAIAERKGSPQMDMFAEIYREKKPAAKQAPEAQPAVEPTQFIKKGDRFTDAQGKTWEVWSARTSLIEAFPVIDGKMRVNNQDGQRWATDDRARSANPEARTDFNPIQQKPQGVTPQVLSNAAAERIISSAADSVKTLRKSDVGRVLDETQATHKLSMATYIKDNRRDLADEVDSVMAEEMPAAESKPIAEMKIRSAFSALDGVQLGKAYPITVEHNGVKREFLAEQRKLSNGKVPAVIHLSTIKSGKLLASDDAGAVVNKFKLTGANELVEEGFPHYADEAELKQWADAGFESPTAKPAEQQATAILDRANVTGKDRLDIMRDFKDGKHSLEDLEKAYPVQSAKPTDEFQQRVTAAQNLIDEVRGTGQRLEMDGLGYVTLYHGTSSQNADAIKSSGKFNTQAYFAPSRKAVEPHAKPKHGSAMEIVSIKVDPRDVEFSTGSGEFYAPDGLERNENGMWGKPAQTEQVANPDQSAIDQADDDLDAALGDLGDIIGRNFRATLTPEQEQKLLPVLVKLFDAAFRKGYYKFKEAARFVLDTIAAKFGQNVADEISIEHLQSGYIGMSGRYKDQGAEKARDVVAIESKGELGENDVTDERSSTDLERNRQDAEAADGMGEEDVRAGRDGDGGAGRPGVEGVEAEGGARGGRGVSGYEAAPAGERGDLEIYTGAPPTEDSIARDSLDQRSDSSGLDGAPVESDATSVTEELIESGLSLVQAKHKQHQADKLEHKPGLTNIRETLPILTEGQQEDVHIAETRFAIPDGYGMLFTNGTGTGKTFLGLGIIKRFVTSGKSNIIIAVPNDKIAADWQTSGKLLGLNISRLENTKSAGSGVVITTYSNFGQNNELAKRDWDLIVHDEAHYLKMDSKGTDTLALGNLRAISLHKDGASTRASMIHADLAAKLRSAAHSAKMARMSDDQRDWANIETLQKKEEALAAEWRKASDAVRDDVAARQGEVRPRVLFLSATPFAYEKTVDWANGYLFDYDEGRSGQPSRSYNAGSNSDQFMMQHFGYRMKYGKLTEPDAKVDRGLMQRQFNTWMKKRGVLAGRMLDVKADYDRRFVLVDSAIGQRIDAALQWFGEQQEDENSNKARNGALSALRDTIGEKFDYLSRRYLLEAIKAQEVIPHVREHMAIGRKVVVFHDYKKGGGFNPFDVTSNTAPDSASDADKAAVAAYNAAVAEFRVEFKDLIASDVWKASSPITAFQKAFPNVLLFNGDIPASQRRANVEKFQDDASGVQVMLVQSAAGKEGISLHDTTGKYQRVLFNLGQPTAPTTAIQQEGRIYRTGQVTDAIIRYLNTGTNWEKWAFATTVANRASAAENLGMGEQARALKDAFIAGFEESDNYRAGMEGEGKGGKERDKAANNALTEYDRARAFYFGTQKKNSRTKAQEGADYFATPEPVGLKMMELADIRTGESVLEPSAGHGAIARWAPETADRTAIEPSMTLRPRLAMVFDGKIIGTNFEDLNVVNKYDAIVMNPPFGSGGRMAIDHLAKAATHLREGGRIVALIPTGPAADAKFDKWFYEESTKPIKPLGEVTIDGVVTPIYRGDTIESRASWAPTGKVTGWRDGAPIVSAGGEFRGAESMVSKESIKDVQPTGKRTESFSPTKGFSLVANITLPSVTFERAGTAVNTRIVVIERSANAPQQTSRDYTDATDINDLFDRMESLSISPRADAREVTPEAVAPKVRGQLENEQAKTREAAAIEQGLVATEGTEITFEIKGDKLITNAPTEKVTTNSGKELEGVFVPPGKYGYAQIKAIDRFTYSPGGREKGLFVRLKHIERPAAKFSQSATPARNPHTLSTLTAAIDKTMGQGFAKLLEATGKFKIISSADIEKYLGDGARFSTEKYSPQDSMVKYPSAKFDGYAEIKPKSYAKEKTPVMVGYLVNPSRLKLLREMNAMRRDSGDSDIRLFKTKEGDIYAWPSFDATHDDIAEALNIKGFVDTRNESIITIEKYPDSAFGKNAVMPERDRNIRYSKDGRILAFVVSGNTYLVADNISSTDDNVRGILTHEISAHALSLGRSEPEFQTILKQFTMIGKMGNEKVKAAQARVPADTPAHLVEEESLGYYLEANPDLKFSQKVIAWFRAQIRKIGASINGSDKLKFFQWANKLTTEDIVEMASQALRSAPQTLAAAQDRGTFKAESKQRAESFARMIVEEFAAENDSAFSIPTTYSKTIEGAILDVMPGVEYLGEQSEADESSQSGAEYVHLFKTEYGDKFKVYESGDGMVWINVADIKKGGGGQDIYSAIADYAFNTNKKFIGDPYGLTMDSIIRRTVNMLISAIKHGTTRHLNAAQQQEWGDPENGVEPLEWSGSDIDKIEALIHTFVTTMQNLAPVLKEYRYDFQSQQFTDGQGRPVDGDAISEALPRAARSGEKTARRAVFIQSALSGASKSVGERSAILERVLGWGEGTRPQNVANLFSKAQQSIPGTTQTPAQPTRQSKMPLQGGQPGNRASWDSPEPSMFDDMVRKLQDKNIDLKRVVQAIKDSGQQVAEKWNAYLQEELFHGRASKRVQDFVNIELKPLMTEMRMRGQTLAELDQFLHARHAREANALIASRDPNMPDGGSGMTNQEADDYFASMPADKLKRLEATAKRVDAILAKTREYYASYGLVSRDTVDGWADMFQHYVPLMREDHDGYMGIGQGFSIKGKEVKHRTGSTAKVVDILANIAMQREKAIVRGEKNRVAVALAGLAKLNPNPDFWSFDKPPTERVLNEKTGLVEERIDPTFRSKPNVVVAKIKDGNGQVHERAVIFNEHNERAVRMAEAMKNLDTTQLGGLMGASAVVTRYFSAINTQYNPIFGVTNLVRDVQGMALNLTSTPLAGKQKEVLGHILSAAKGIYLDARAEREGHPATSVWAGLWEELQDQGGMTGYRDMYRTSEDRGAAIEHELDPHNWVNSKWGQVFTAGGMLKVPLTKAQDVAAPLFGWLSDYNLMMEGATRLSIYKTAIDNGLTKQEAASLAKNTTVNFNRKGSSGVQAGALYAFFNAAMQGTARIGETVFDMQKGDIKTLRLSKTGQKIVAGGMLLGVMQALALAASGFDDDDPPEFIRERNLIIPIGWVVGGKRYISIPMPLGFHAIPNIGRIATEYAMGGFKKPADHVFRLVGVFAEAFNPMGSSGMSLQTIAPTALDPFAALEANKDWTGKPIYKEDFSSLDPTPGFTRNKDTASAWSKFMAEGINYATGGTDYTPGTFSPTADQIDYLIGQVTGGVGREASKLTQTVGAGFSGEELPTHKMPLVGRFYGNLEDQSSQGNRYYTNLKDINAIDSELTGRRKDGLPTEEFRKENPEARLIMLAKSTDRQVRDLRRKKSELIKQDAERARIREIEERITAKMRKLNDRVAEVRAN